MLYIEAYNTAIEEMDKHYFEQHPDASFNYFLFQQSTKKQDMQSKITAFLTRLDELKFYQALKNKEDYKCEHCPENIRMLWNAIKIACFIISIPDLNYKDLLYHNITLSLGDLYGLEHQFQEALPAMSDHLQAIVLRLHPDSVKEIESGDKYKFFRASRSDPSVTPQVSPSIVKRPLTFT